jgi:hypothetical protein
VEGRRPAHDERFLPRRLLTATAAFGLAITIFWASPAFAGNTETQNTTTADATASGGTITVDAGSESWTPPAGSPWAQAGQSDPPPGKPNPNQPYGCTYTAAPQSADQQLGVGGAAPGQWVFPVCAGPGVIDPMPPIWVTNAQPQAAPANPTALAQQALSTLPLPAPAIEMAPPADQDQLVNVSTWLWIDPSAWRSLSATAAAGPVSATATATPAEVVWQMGDGHTVTCLGPGTPYDPSEPNATTNCQYTWTQSSAGQPGGTYQVTATVYWQATWAASGAPGGGSLGLVPGPTAQVAVRVAESQAVNTAPGS